MVYKCFSPLVTALPTFKAFAAICWSPVAVVQLGWSSWEQSANWNGFQVALKWKYQLLKMNVAVWAAHPCLSAAPFLLATLLHPEALVVSSLAWGFLWLSSVQEVFFSSKRIQLLKTGGRLALGDCCNANSLLAATYAAVAQNLLNKVCATQGSASTLCQWKIFVGCK